MGFVLLILGTILIIFQKFATVVTKNKVTPSPSLETSSEKVIRVIDGDSIVLSNGEEVRYIGINTPEIENNECFATISAKINSDLVLGKDIKLTKDTSETDNYGRLLRYVYLGDTFINDYLLKNGYAKVMLVSPDVKFEKEFGESENYAKENSLGLWGNCPN